MSEKLVQDIIAPLKCVELRSYEFARILEFLATRVRIFDGPADRAIFENFRYAIESYLRSKT